ncbi:hypothetical protein CONLIGDRAFT_155519 [Coniochaeta ligniaria NRRL 30616]|uniref:CBM1 domain-containing protein n=1 Tax=Coniochaeta ligniaria NRRL 30616 TaxID=1408157 RepID=A0A1J7JHR4_9PEZI|nr:hypothetical protein CONLIGDRAFT_155519 [Coniochaeta ligniaria NRRL 30616]
MLSKGYYVGIFLAAAATANAAVAACSADNCYRAMFPCQSPAAWSSATSFCATITAGGTTATNYPTRATAACGTASVKYLSVCGCGPTCTPTTTTSSPTPTATTCPPMGLVPNGDFECDTMAWTVQVPDSAASTSIFSPGNTGSKAFQVHTRSAPITPEQGVSARIISSTINVAANVPSKLTFASFFTNSDAGAIGVLINDAPVYVIDGQDAPAGVWHGNSIDYTPSTDQIVIKFEFLFGPYPSYARIDTVNFNFLH